MARLNVLSTGAEWSDRRRVWQQWCQMGDHSSCHLENACKAVHEGSCLQGRLLPHSPTNVVVILTLSRSTVECRCVHTCKSIHPCSAAYLGCQSQGLKSNHTQTSLCLATSWSSSWGTLSSLQRYNHSNVTRICKNPPASWTWQKHLT